IHLYRLKDMKQVITRARELHAYQPKHMDTFIFEGNRYTVDGNKAPQKGDYILINQPAPEFLDHYSLNEIEKVDKAENGNVVTTRDNGVRYHEYAVLVPGRAADSKDIAYDDQGLVPNAQRIKDESPVAIQKAKLREPAIGDVYYDKEQNRKVMIVATGKSEIVFGDGEHLQISELLNENRYTLVGSLMVHS